MWPAHNKGYSKCYAIAQQPNTDIYTPAKTHTPQWENTTTTPPVNPLQDHNNTTIHTFQDNNITIILPL